jgi:ribonuclease E
MTKRMLIDATHPEETRVVALNGKRLEEFDFETSTKKQLKGNIYLAKVTRVEPSLQAAFVEFGGNRHGFLAFSEIHPDYYQIPVADRAALLREHEEALAAEAAEEEAEDEEQEITIEQAREDAADDDGDGEAEASDDAAPENTVDEAGDGDAGEEASDDAAPALEGEVLEPVPHSVEEVGGEDETDQHAERRRVRHKRHRYKIQEVIKRRQILLIQVVKEERGNKGAALTTYLSLAGRYCVLMPNTAKGGGISRKITSAGDRKRLKSLLTDLDIPDGMAIILRTAAVERSRPELKRDFEFLMRAWDTVRELTLSSIAPTLVYEEANLIKRSIRDLYTKDIDEVLVEGEEGYRTAKEFMRMLMPSHAKKVQPYRDPEIPLFHRYQVESQLDAMHSATVQLKSGGYIVINPTEALVSIDVNSGRATRERNIEETAYKTNLEAAEEIARQLKLRDLAGLIVIDFIDMSENRNQHTVERRMKEAMRNDRARIQIGRISAFGLLELSRQRLRPSLAEASTQSCPHCEGTGLIRSTESAALHVLRVIEDEGIRRRSTELRVKVSVDVALYILNQKRDRLNEIEARYGFRVLITGDDSLIPPAHEIDRVEGRPLSAAPATSASLPIEDEEVEADAEIENETEETPDEGRAESDENEGQTPRRRRRRRPRRGRKRDDEGEGETEGNGSETAPAQEEGDSAESAESSSEGESEAGQDSEGDGEEKPKRRRRGRRGGRRRGRKRDEDGESAAETTEPVAAESEATNGTGNGSVDDTAVAAENVTEAPAAEAPAKEAPVEVEDVQVAAAEEAAPAPETTLAPEPEVTILPDAEPEKSKAPQRKGWWNRFSG